MESEKQNVCQQLAHKLFNQDRTLYIDNFYTTYELAISRLKQKTHIVGTVRKNKKFISQRMISKEDEDDIVVLK